MEITPAISRITIYPIKSLDGLDLQKAQIGSGGCLLHDRAYAIKGLDLKYVNGKKNPLVHLLRMKIDLDRQVVFFRHQSESQWHEFSLTDQKIDIDKYLSVFFGMPVNLHKNTEGRFLDEPDISGMTILSTASLQEVSAWFGNMPVAETRKRFRATLEVSHVPAFWEDQLFNDESKAVAFTIGDVKVLGMGPRARCIVPTRHPDTGAMIHAFQKSFTQKRSESLPPWSALPNYNHNYYLSVDCMLPKSEVGKWIQVGDAIKIAAR